MATYHPHHLLTATTASHPTSLVFDPYADLLWTGSSTGHVQSFSSPQSFTRNVAFPAHGATGMQAWSGMGKGGVKEMFVGDREIVTLGERGLGGRKRGGLVKWSVSEGASSLCSMCISPTNSSEIIAGGTQPQMLVVNTHTGSVVRQVDSLSNLLFLRRTPRFVASGSADGLVRFHDPRAGLKTEQSFSAHLGGLTGLETAGWNVMTMGYTVKQGHPLPDPMVNVYDVRTFRPLPPVSFAPGPAFVLAHPKNPSSLVVASAQGMFQTTDLNKPGEASFHQLDVTSFLTAAAISSSGSFLAFGDADGSTHVWSTEEEDTSSSTFNGYEGISPEWPDPIEPLPQIPWTPETPLNLIGMPHYSSPLLSNLPDSIYCPPASSPFFHPPAKIPVSVVQTMKTDGHISYSTAPKDLKGTRNKVAGSGSKGLGGSTGKRRVSEPRFRSEKEREALKSGGAKVEKTVETPENAFDAQIAKYRKVEIKYSKFGVEDFDFGFYNSTRYSGLETHIANSYTNSILQALHYTLPFRTVAKSHLSTPCPKEHCLLCEAGFLFRMLEDAQGTNCQASNFSRAFAGTSQALALGLYDTEDAAAPKAYAPLVQNLTRFLLESMSVEANTYPSNPWLSRNRPPPSMPVPSAISQVCGFELQQTNACLTCGWRTSRGSTLHTLELIYPRKALSNEAPVPKDFLAILHSSITRDVTTKVVCIACKQYAPLRARRVLAEGSILPPVVTINAAVHSPEHLEDIWIEKATSGSAKPHFFLPPTFAVVAGEDDFRIEGPEKKATWGEGVAVYDLRALVVEIQSGTEDRHLVSIIKIPVDELDQDVTSPWFVFNDFLVTNISEQEALSFAGGFKTPAVLVYERTDSSMPLELSSLPMGIDPSILSRDVSISWNRNPNLIKHRNYSPEELPGPGTLVAIDAEFVAMQLDDYEYRSDGTKKVVRPSRLSLARVSVLRGSGPSEEMPFIDDHIHTSEPVMDYLTDFSGIHNGDLDPHTSGHTLVPLKVAYKKLRLLVDLGCIFIGHGLKKDFRIINIFVPPEQVLDTVDLFYSPTRQRKMSLRFLAWFLLKNDIQLGEHDSIEDARSALQLFRMYLQFEQDGRLEDVMDDVFAEGKRLNWKPPGVPATSHDLFTPNTRSLVSTPDPQSQSRSLLQQQQQQQHPLQQQQHQQSSLQHPNPMRRLPNGPPFPSRPPSLPPPPSSLPPPPSSFPPLPPPMGMQQPMSWPQAPPLFAPPWGIHGGGGPGPWGGGQHHQQQQQQQQVQGQGR